MQATLQQYAERIRQGRINPVTYYDGRRSGLILDPTAKRVPLNILGFGVCQLEQGPFRFHTKGNEYVLVPVTAEFRIQCGKDVFAGKRTEGPFAARPKRSNASAVYIPRKITFELRGQGEMIFYTAPATGDRPAAVVQARGESDERRGCACWQRSVLPLVTPEKTSTRLIVGETYCLPGMWSGIPPPCARPPRSGRRTIGS